MAKSNSMGKVIGGLILLLVIGYVAYGLIEKCWTPWKPSSCNEGFTSQQMKEISDKNKAKQQEHFNILKKTVQKNRDEKNQIMDNLKQLSRANAKMKRDILESRNMNDKLKENFTSRINSVNKSNIEKFKQLRAKLNFLRRKEKFATRNAIIAGIKSDLNQDWNAAIQQNVNISNNIKSMVNTIVGDVAGATVDLDDVASKLSILIGMVNSNEFYEDIKNNFKPAFKSLSSIQINLGAKAMDSLNTVDSALDKISSDIQNELVALGTSYPGLFGRPGGSEEGRVDLPPAPHKFVGHPWTLPSHLSDKDWCARYSSTIPIQREVITDNARSACMYLPRPCSKDINIYNLCQSLGQDQPPAANCTRDAAGKNINCGVNQGVNSDRVKLQARLMEFVSKLEQLGTTWNTGRYNSEAYRLELNSLLWLFTGSAENIPTEFNMMWTRVTRDDGSEQIERTGRNPFGWDTRSMGDVKHSPVTDPQAVGAMTSSIRARLETLDDSTSDNVAVESFMNVRRKEKFGRHGGGKMNKLAFLHSNHCGHCRNVMPDWKDFCNKHRNDPDVEIITLESAELETWSGPQPKYFPVWFYTTDGGRTWHEARVPRNEQGWASLPVFVQQYGA